MYAPTASSLKSMFFFRMDSVTSDTKQKLYNSYSEKWVETTNMNANAKFNPDTNAVDFVGLYFH